MILNLGYRWICTDVPSLRGNLLLPSGNNRERLERTNLPYSANMLFDPQLYLCETLAEDDPRLCARLVTYPWFCADIDRFDSSDLTRREWERSLLDQIDTIWLGEVPSTDRISECVQSVIDFQLNLGFSRLILPSPLVTEREGEAIVQLEWLESAIELLADIQPGQPTWFTVAVSEAALNEQAFAANGLLDAVIDQVSSRSEIDGVYIVIAQTYLGHPLNMSANVARAYAHLVAGFRTAGVREVCCNFCDVFGIACLGLGATLFATGPSQSTRRLSLQAAKGGGFALPNYYSHPAVAEFRTERDLDAIVAGGLLGSVQCHTPYCETLLEHLQEGGSAADLVDWAEAPNNVVTAQCHFLAALATASRDLFGVPARRRRNMVREWLSRATDVIAVARQHVGAEAVSATPQEWLAIFDDYAT